MPRPTGNFSALFARNSTDELREMSLKIFSRPVRQFLNRVPGLPRRASRYLDEVRFLEPDVIRILKRLIQPGWICADVGAHSGTVTVRLAEYCAPNGKVFAFEPIPENFQSLRTRISGYGYDSRVETNQFAVTEKSGGTVDLFPGDHTTTWSVFGSTEKQGTREKTTVSTISLDGFFKTGTRLDFIKIDVEGAESLVLSGAARILAESRPAILVEFHNLPAWAGADRLWENSYRLFDLNGRELPRGQRPAEAYCHCLALPE